MPAALKLTQIMATSTEMHNKINWFLKRHGLSSNPSNIKQLGDLIVSGSNPSASKLWNGYVVPDGGGVDGYVYVDGKKIQVSPITPSVVPVVPNGLAVIDRNGYVGAITVRFSGAEIGTNSTVLLGTDSSFAWTVQSLTGGLGGTITVDFFEGADLVPTYTVVLEYGSGGGGGGGYGYYGGAALGGPKL